MRAVNLLPPDLRGASKTTAELSVASEASGGAGPFVVLGVLAACVAGVAGYVLAGNTVKQRQAELADVTTRQQAIAAQAAALKPYADFDSKAKARVQTVRDIADSRFDWQQSLSDLARAIPANITLKSLTGDLAGAGTIGGSALRGAISSPAITLDGCAPGQTDVARLMSRLHSVDGVTRVSLAKSDNVEVQSQDSTVSETKRRNAAPCGAGAHPNFEIVAFFEHASAAVAAPAAASAAAAPTPTPTPTATPSGTSATTTSTEGATP